MSYCVNCGVELEKSEKKCPLCGVMVQNPTIQNQKEERLYPNFIVQRKKSYFTVNRIKMYSYLLAFPFFLTLFLNLLINRAITWSIYTMASLLLFWIYAALPFLIKNRTVGKIFTIDVLATALFLLIVDLQSGAGMWSLYVISSILLVWIFSGLPLVFKNIPGIIIVLIDGIATALFLWLIERLSQSGPWFLSLALPLVSLVTGVIVTNFILKKLFNLRPLGIFGMILLSVGLSGIGIDLIINNYLHIPGFSIWSIIQAIVCIPLAGILLFIYINRDLYIYLKKKLHL